MSLDKGRVFKAARELSESALGLTQLSVKVSMGYQIARSDLLAHIKALRVDLLELEQALTLEESNVS